MDASILLARLAEQPGLAAIILDVDGTLAPIVSRPVEASVPDRTRGILAGLVSRYGLVACLSGRPGEEASRIVGVEGIRYVGEHGLELDADAERCADRLAAFAQTTSWPHEHGKRLSLAFHFRDADDETAARAELEGIAQRAREAGLRPRWGRMVLEVRPPVDADKGTAVRRLVGEAGVRAALYAGDDTTDVDAFAGLDGLDGLDIAIRVAVLSDEAPEQLLRAADVLVDGPEALVSLLETL